MDKLMSVEFVEPGLIVMDVHHNTEQQTQEKPDDNNHTFVWQKLKPLPDPLKPVQQFDFDLLPSTFKPWIIDISHRMQCPPDFAAIGAMISLSAVIGRRVGIHPKSEDDWLVISNLWGAAVGRPSAMKTPALDEVVKPLKRLEVEAKEEYVEKLEDFELSKSMLELQKEDAKNKAKKAIKDGKPGNARAFLADRELALPEPPIRERYIINDATVEKLGELLNENPNGILLMRDELSGWLKTIDREDRSNDRAFYLQAFNGTGRYTYDRIGRGTIDIEAASISIVGGIQPSKLRPYVVASITGNYADDGLLQRFQLLVYPDTNKSWKYIDRKPNGNAKNTVFAVFKTLAEDMRYPEPEEGTDIPALRFDEEAQRLFITLLTDLEEDIRADDLHPAMEAHLTKYRSLIPSLVIVPI